MFGERVGQRPPRFAFNASGRGVRGVIGVCDLRATNANEITDDSVSRDATSVGVNFQSVILRLRDDDSFSRWLVSGCGVRLCCCAPSPVSDRSQFQG